KTYLSDDILTKVDRASMAVSLEVRAPLLDHKLMELVANIPSCLKVRRDQGKYIFKKAMSTTLPYDLLHRPKRGFCIPVDRWFRRELRDFAHDSIFANSAGILNVDYMRRIWAEHQDQRANRAAHLWALMMFVRWQQIVKKPVIDNEQAATGR